MKTLLITALILCTLPAFSQSEQWEYLKASLIDAGFNSETRITIDDGSKQIKLFKSLPFLVDSTGSPEFKSPIDAMNFLGSQGWEAISVVSTKALSGGDQYILFKRRKR